MPWEWHEPAETKRFARIFVSVDSSAVSFLQDSFKHQCGKSRLAS